MNPGESTIGLRTTALKGLASDGLRPLFYLLSALVLLELHRRSGQGLLGTGGAIWSFGHFFLIGVIAATVANATGTGGGVVFLPAFMALGLAPGEALGTSFAIQCFGMTAGALAWLSHGRARRVVEGAMWSPLLRIVSWSGLASCAGLLLAQYGLGRPAIDVKLLFALFSLAVGAAIALRTLYARGDRPRDTGLAPQELIELIAVGFVGGVITAWLSVGVGELLAIYLLYRRFHTNVAIASAVCVSSISVLCGVVHYVVVEPTIHFDVLIFAAPGALVGGTLARRLAVYVGPRRLKIGFASWIVFSSLAYLVAIQT